MDDLIGTVVLGRFRIDAELGRGAMGAVYRGTHIRLARDVAIKVMHDHLRNKQLLDRFRREAKVAGKMSHPNLMSVLDAGETLDGRPVMVLELAAGRTLIDILEVSPAPRRVIRLVKQILLGLGYAHEAGLIHRDLKPDNIMVEIDHDGTEIEVMIDTSGGQINTTQTLFNRGIPYIVDDEPNTYLDVVSFTGLAPVLTIEPGVILKFHPGGRLRIDTTGGHTAPAKGALIAVGTAANPIVFTSVSPTPAAGDWGGIYFSGLMNAATRMDFTRVEYAGGPSASGSGSCPYPGRVGQNDAAIRILGTPAPSQQFITNTTILASARDGIDRGWTKDGLTDFQSTNTFTGVAECDQSFPRQTSTTCPTTPPCP